jgi:hypothetical protein
MYKLKSLKGSFCLFLCVAVQSFKLRNYLRTLIIKKNEWHEYFAKRVNCNLIIHWSAKGGECCYLHFLAISRFLKLFAFLKLWLIAEKVYPCSALISNFLMCELCAFVCLIIIFEHKKKRNILIFYMLQESKGVVWLICNFHFHFVWE